MSKVVIVCLVGLRSLVWMGYGGDVEDEWVLDAAFFSGSEVLLIVESEGVDMSSAT